jgi:nucleoside-diphosphate-sugar epimerase
MTQPVLVTGASGFVGRALLARLVADPAFSVRAAVRPPRRDFPTEVEQVQVDSLGPGTCWQVALAGVDVVVHAAARVHVMRDTSSDPLREFRHTNVAGTLTLARQAAAAGVRRFIFLSSIKVNGESTAFGRPYLAYDAPAPLDPYGISKREAEDELRKLAAATAMEVVVVRPPLVYGPGVKGNFLTLMRWLYRGVPLPLGAVANRRSVVALDNLIDLIVTCIGHPAAANRTFTVSDGEDLSTTELLRRLAAALGKPARLLPIPHRLLKGGLMVAGRRELAQRLCGSLQVDISQTRAVLGWIPPISVDEGLRKTAEAFLRDTAQPAARAL